MSDFLSRDEILSVEDYVTDVVDAHEWGGKVRVRSLEASHRARIESTTYEVNRAGKGYEKITDMAVKVVIWGCINEKGDRLFSDADLKALMKKNPAPIERIENRILELSGLKQGAVEAAAEDFSDAQSSNSSTD